MFTVYKTKSFHLIDKGIPFLFLQRFVFGKISVLKLARDDWMAKHKLTFVFCFKNLLCILFSPTSNFIHPAAVTVQKNMGVPIPLQRKNTSGKYVTKSLIIFFKTFKQCEHQSMCNISHFSQQENYFYQRFYHLFTTTSFCRQVDW